MFSIVGLGFAVVVAWAHVWSNVALPLLVAASEEIRRDLPNAAERGNFVSWGAGYYSTRDFGTLLVVTFALLLVALLTALGSLLGISALLAGLGVK